MASTSLGERPETDPPHTAFRRHLPCQHLDLGPLATRSASQYISVVKSCLWFFLTAAVEH